MRRSTTPLSASRVVTSRTASAPRHRGSLLPGGGGSCRPQGPGGVFAGCAARRPDTAYAASLAKIPDSDAETRGVTFGELAADTLIKQRAHDGRNASVKFTQERRQVCGGRHQRPPHRLIFPLCRPMALDRSLHCWSKAVHSSTNGAPPKLTSEQYTREFNEVKALGSLNSTERTTQQTDTAKFYSGNGFVQFNTALHDQVSLRKLDSVDAARMFAAVNMSLADAAISIWHAKYLYPSGGPSRPSSWPKPTATPRRPPIPAGNRCRHHRIRTM